MKKRPSSKCLICKRPDVAAIDAALRAARPLVAVAEEFGASKSGLHRHHTEHLPRKASASTPPQLPSPSTVPLATMTRPEDMLRVVIASAQADLERLASEGLSVFETSKLRTSALRAIDLATKLQGREISEAVIARHPATRRVLEALVSAVTATAERPCANCGVPGKDWTAHTLRAIGEALTRMGEEQGDR